MFDKVKSLDNKNKIVFSTQTQGMKIFNITGKLQILKAYKLQYDVLGYIVSSGQVIKGREKINDLVNTQINRHLPHYREAFATTHTNARNLCYSCLLRGRGSKMMHDKLVKAKDNINIQGYADIHVIKFQRLVKIAARKGIDLDFKVIC